MQAALRQHCSSVASPNSLYTNRIEGTGRRISDGMMEAILWVLLAVLTAAAILWVVRPLIQGRIAGTSETAANIEFYKSQLLELDKEVETGAVDPREADDMRREISRRLLAVADRKDAAVQGGGRIALWSARLIILAVPLLALSIYLALGRPGLPDQPLTARLNVPLEQMPVGAMIVKIEEHLRDNPEDAEGWHILAPLYQRLGRFADATDAYRRLLRIEGESAELVSAYGEALVMAAEGDVTPAARQAFDRALELDPTDPRARYYVGLAEIRSGQQDEGLARWRALLAEAPEDADWRQGLAMQIAALEGRSNDPAAIAALPQGEQQARIKSMVEGLAQRLNDNPDDLQGWIRLVTSYRVLGEEAAANEALERALAHFANDAAARSALQKARSGAP